MLIAATSPFIQSLEHVMGFLLVMVALWLLYGLTALVGRFFIARTPARPPAAPLRAPVVASGELGEEEVVAITACVTTLMGRRSRIVSIRSGGAKDWSREGRREHFASHKIR